MYCEGWDFTQGAKWCGKDRGLNKGEVFALSAKIAFGKGNYVIDFKIKGDRTQLFFPLFCRVFIGVFAN